MLQFTNDIFVLGGVGRLNYFVADRGEVKVGNESSRLQGVRAEKDIANTDIPMVHTPLVQGGES